MNYVVRVIGVLGLILHVGLLSALPHDLVDIQSINPRIRIDIKYATSDNFTHKKVYEKGLCYLRRAVAEKLDLVQKELETMGLGLLIWDGYRPRRVQYIFWDLVPDERYVGNPAKGSKHNRGAAVDLTLVKLDGTPLLMPTEFDDFSEKAHADYKDLPAEAIKNRELLRSIMAKYGFTVIPTEWWHFDYKDWQSYDLLDISFTELEGGTPITS